MCWLSSVGMPSRESASTCVLCLGWQLRKAVLLFQAQVAAELQSACTFAVQYVMIYSIISFLIAVDVDLSALIDLANSFCFVVISHDSELTGNGAGN